MGIGHRGASQAAPENTLAAFQAALPGGFELDVQRLSDGTVVALHDKTLERTGRGKRDLLLRPIETLNLADIAEVDVGAWKAPEFAGERVPKLAEALALLAAHPEAHAFVEL